MNTIELIKKKRENGELSSEEIKFLINNYTKGKIPDYQFSAFLMATYFNGMSIEETASLTEAMLCSGTIINLDSIPACATPTNVRSREPPVEKICMYRTGRMICSSCSGLSPQESRSIIQNK